MRAPTRASIGAGGRRRRGQLGGRRLLLLRLLLELGGLSLASILYLGLELGCAAAATATATVAAATAEVASVWDDVAADVAVAGPAIPPPHHRVINDRVLADLSSHFPCLRRRSGARHLLQEDGRAGADVVAGQGVGVVWVEDVFCFAGHVQDDIDELSGGEEGEVRRVMGW